MRSRRASATIGAATVLLALAGCATGPATHLASSLPVTSVAAPVTSAAAPPPKPTPHPSTPHRNVPPTHTAVPRSSTSSAAPRPAPSVPGAPVIVIDPGHSVTVSGTDPATGLNVADYENEPEMRDVYAVAQIVQRELTAAGYHVIMTKKSLYAPTNLGTRADVANAAHAALALSIHDQAGSNGGIGFDAGNNIVYYQSVGDYRTNPEGRRITFTDSAVATLSRRYAQVFQQKRAAAQHTSVTLLGNTGYDLGGRGLQGGDIWIVQLLARVPWIYNEAGGNSAGMVGLSSGDKQRYADGLVAAVMSCVPVR